MHTTGKGARKVSQVAISTVASWDGQTGVGIILRSRQGVGVRKLAYLAQDPAPERVIYAAVLVALAELAETQATGATVLLESAEVVDQLNRRTTPPGAVRDLYVQLRCRANSLWPTRFELGKPAATLVARQLAQYALERGEPVAVLHGTPLLPLVFEAPLVA